MNNTFEFLSTESREHTANVLEALPIFVQSFDKLLNTSQLNVKRWEYYPVSANKWLVYDIFVTHWKRVSKPPISLCPVIGFITTVPLAYEAWILCISWLLSQKKVHHFQINADHPVMFFIFYWLENFLDRLILFLQCSWVANWNWTVG